MSGLEHWLHGRLASLPSFDLDLVIALLCCLGKITREARRPEAGNRPMGRGPRWSIALRADIILTKTCTHH